MRIPEFVQAVKRGEIDIVEHTHKVLDICAHVNSEYHYFTAITQEALQRAKELSRRKEKRGVLWGVPVSAKDAISVMGVETTGGSRILKGYMPLFDATAVEKLRDEGAIIIGKTSQDEFGFGSFGINVGKGYEISLNPFDKRRVCGGSSAGSAGITQKLDTHASLGESTGGSIVNPASFCGVVGLTPTYGRVSRHGLLDYGTSFDKIGPMAKSVEDAAYVLSSISGHDKADATSANIKKEAFHSFVKKDIRGMKMGVIKGSLENADTLVQKGCQEGIRKLEEQGCEIRTIELPITMKYGVSCYYLLATAEASTNLARYSGMRYGTHEELKGDFNSYFSDVRSGHFGKEAKRRIMLGTFARMAGFRDAYYLKAAKIRTLIVNEYKKAFKRVDALVSPTVPKLPLTFDEVKRLSVLENYMFDVLTVGPNVAGIPHMSVPVSMQKGLPVGLMLMTDHFEEGKLVQIGSKAEMQKQ